MINPYAHTFMLASRTDRYIAKPRLRAAPKTRDENRKLPGWWRLPPKRP